MPHGSGTIKCMKNIIVAYDRNRGIGADNDLLWQRDLPADLAHFRRLTVGKTVIMGRKTFESIGSKPLADRQNIVVTSRPTGINKVLSALSLNAAFALAQYEPFVIGGAQLYAAAIDEVDRIFATEVDGSFPEATVHFPPIDLSSWYEASRDHRESDECNKYACDFVLYQRKP